MVKFKKRKSWDYPTKMLRIPYKFIVALMCKLYGEVDASIFKESPFVAYNHNNWSHIRLGFYPSSHIGGDHINNKIHSAKETFTIAHVILLVFMSTTKTCGSINNVFTIIRSVNIF